VKATLRESSHGPLMRLDVRSDSLAERSGFELPVPLISYQNARSLPVSFSPSPLPGANGESGTDRERPRSLVYAIGVIRMDEGPSKFLALDVQSPGLS
jgi:hypothetical protein